MWASSLNNMPHRNRQERDPILATVMLYMFFLQTGAGLDVFIQPSSCYCQQNNSYVYTCIVANATGFSWIHQGSYLLSYGSGSTVGLTQSLGLFELSLISKIKVGEYTYNFSSTLEVSNDDLINSNATDITCTATAYETLSKSVVICILGPPIPAQLMLKEVSSSAVEATVSPPIFHNNMWEECNMSYVVQTDTGINCVYRDAFNNFLCSDLNLYTELYNFVVSGQLQDDAGIIVGSIILTMNSTRINHLGSSLLPVANITVSESLDVVVVHWTEPANNADSVTYYKVHIEDTYYYTINSITAFVVSVSTFEMCNSYSISVVPCAFLTGCMENSRSEIYTYVFAQRRYFHSFSVKLQYTCSYRPLVDVSLQVDDFQMVQPQNVCLQWGFDDVSLLTSPQILAVLPYTQSFHYNDLPSMGVNIIFAVHLEHQMCKHKMTEKISVTNIVGIKEIQTGIYEAFLYIEENQCAINATGMCIVVHYGTSSSNYTKNIQRFSNVVELGFFKMENLLEDTEYEFRLMVVENCNYSDAVVGWNINGSFSTKAKSKNPTTVILITTIVCGSGLCIIVLAIIAICLLLGGCFHNRQKSQPEAIYEDPDSVIKVNCKIEENVSYAHMH